MASPTNASSSAHAHWAPWFRLVPVAALAIVVLSLWYWCTLHLDARMASGGFSTELTVMLHFHPELFKSDFPGGAEELIKSAVWKLYLAAYALGVSPAATQRIMTLAEISVFASAVVYAARQLVSVPVWPAAFLTSIVLIASTIAQPNLAYFAFPYYGWVYCFAYAGFLYSIAETAHLRLLRAAIGLVLTFAVHPIIGVFAGVFVVSMLAITRPSRRLLLAPLGLVMAGGGTAFALINSAATLTGGGIDPALFVALARFFNYHWFPSYMGTFWEDHARLFLPFLGTVSLALMSFQRRGQPIDRLGLQCLAGFLAMLALTLLGIVVSLVSESAFLIKLALHRASLNALMVGGIFIVARAYHDFVCGGRVERAMAAAILVAPFHSSSGIAPGLAVIRVGYEVAVANATWRAFSLLAASGTLAASIVVLFTIYAANGLVPIGFARQYFGLNLSTIASAAVGAMLPSMPLLLGLLSVVVVAGHGVAWGRHLNPFEGDAGARTWAYALLDAQLWAKNNTPAGSLFMVDPLRSSVWRDKSHRPSFGTVREWVHTCCLYNSRSEVLDEGMKRLRELNVDVTKYIFDKKATRMVPVHNAILADASKQYYRWNRDDFRRIANNYGVRYFVFDKSQMKSTPLPLIYENEHMAIAEAPAD